jgi:hypothetical protein
VRLPAPPSPKDFQIRIIRTFKELKPHAEAWDNLALQSPQQLPDLSYAWTVSHLEHQLTPTESWFCLLAYDRSSLVGVLPVVTTLQKRMGMNRTCFRTPYNDQTASIDFLIQRGREEEVIPLFIAQLPAIDPAWFSFEMRHLPDGSPSLAMLGRGIMGIKSVAGSDGWGCFIRVRGSVEELQKKLKPNFKKNLRKAEHKFLSLKDAKLSFVSGEAHSEEALRRFIEVEKASWKFDQGSAIIQSDSLVSFYKALTGRLGDLGWLEWQFLEAEGKALAALMTIRVNRSLVALKICFDEAYAAFSPGIYLLAKTVERAFASGRVAEVNLLTDYPWFYHWPVEKRSYYNITMFPSRFFPLFAGYYWMMIRLKSGRISALRRLHDVWRRLSGDPKKDG